MRALLIALGCLLASHATAQDIARHQYIKLTYAQHQAYVEQAIDIIEASSKILSATVVEYRAGQSVLLQPGFQASSGSTFTAHIKPVSDVNLQLTAYPNPFEQSTTIEFTLPVAGLINLMVVDEKGGVIDRLLENSPQSAGRHQVEWKAETVSPGIYIPLLRTAQQQVSSRVIKK